MRASAPSPAGIRARAPKECVWCGHSAAPSFAPSKAFRSSSWPTWHCPKCGVEFIWPIPQPSTLARYYAYSSYAAATYASADGLRRNRMLEFDRVLRRVRASAGRCGRLLDIGSSVGEMVEVAQALGWTCTGIEIDPETAEIAQRRTGARIRAGTIHTALGPDDTFDLIVLSHSLEHSPTPRTDVQAALRHLAPGGLLLLRLPNATSRSARLMGIGWYWYTPPIHISYFDADSVRHVARELGLIERWTEYQGEGWFRFMTEWLAMPLRLALRHRWTSGSARGDAEPVFPGTAESSQGSSPTSLEMRQLLSRIADRIARLASLGRSRAGFHDSEFAILLQRGAQA